MALGLLENILAIFKKREEKKKKKDKSIKYLQVGAVFFMDY